MKMVFKTERLNVGFTKSDRSHTQVVWLAVVCN